MRLRVFGADQPGRQRDAASPAAILSSNSARASYSRPPANAVQLEERLRRSEARESLQRLRRPSREEAYDHESACRELPGDDGVCAPQSARATSAGVGAIGGSAFQQLRFRVCVLSYLLHAGGGIQDHK